MAFGVLISLGLAKVVAIATVATVAKRKRAEKNRKKKQEISLGDKKKATTEVA